MHYVKLLQSITEYRRAIREKDKIITMLQVQIREYQYLLDLVEDLDRYKDDEEEDEFV
jgi:hypothetical protein